MEWKLQNQVILFILNILLAFCANKPDKYYFKNNINWALWGVFSEEISEMQKERSLGSNIIGQHRYIFCALKRISCVSWRMWFYAKYFIFLGFAHGAVSSLLNKNHLLTENNLPGLIDEVGKDALRDGAVGGSIGYVCSVIFHFQKISNWGFSFFIKHHLILKFFIFRNSANFCGFCMVLVDS